MGERRVIMVGAIELWWIRPGYSLEREVGVIVGTDWCNYEMVPLFLPAPKKGDVLVIESRPNDRMSAGVSWRVVEEEDPNV